MRVVTSEEMKTIDRIAIQEKGIPSLSLMENAGSSVVRAIEDRYGSLTAKRILVLVGRGNNGGDGLVAARHLLNKGAQVKVFMLHPANELSPECLKNFEIFKALNGEYHYITERDIHKLKLSIGISDIVIDAILGIGAKGPLKGLYATVVEILNSIDCKVVAIDVPSGVDATTGKVESVAVRADLTVVLGLMKQGLLLLSGLEYVGDWVVADIGIPYSLASTVRRFVTDESLYKAIPTRPRDGHKGTFGHGLVVAGSRTMAGAAYLTSIAMLRAGAGMVTLAVPESIAGLFPPSEIMIVPIPDTRDGCFGRTSIAKILELFPGKDALVLGPGLARIDEITEVVLELLLNWKGPLVLDADGINAISGQEDLILAINEEQRKNWILTPHPGEMSRLTGVDLVKIIEDRVSIAYETQKKLQVNVVLKGFPTIVVGPKQLYLNITGNPGMASAGMGDILSGIIGGLLCQKVAPLEAAALGVYVHGKAGDCAKQTKGERALIASDVIDALPAVL